MHYRLLGLLMLAGCLQVYAQDSQLEGNTARVKTFDESLPIYNGRLFYGYHPMSNSIPYYKSMGWHAGSIKYDGHWYYDQLVIYDAVTEQLVVRNPRYISLALFSERIQEFFIDGDHFIRLYPDSNYIIREGFHRVLVEGTVTIYQRHVKIIKEEVKGDHIELNAETINRYYALKDGRYYAIGKQQSLLNLLKDKRQAVQQHLRSQGVKFKREPERAITLMATFYNQSTN